MSLTISANIAALNVTTNHLSEDAHGRLFSLRMECQQDKWALMMLDAYEHAAHHGYKDPTGALKALNSHLGSY